MLSTRAQALAAMVVVQLGFGGYGIVLKQFASDSGLNPVLFGAMRDVCCFALLFTVAFATEGKGQFVVRPTKASQIVVFSILGFTMFGNQLLYILGVYYTTPNIASIYQPIIPVWATFFSFLFRVERVPSLTDLPGWLTIAGILVAVGGAVVMIVLAPSSSSSSASNLLLGNLFLVGNTLCMGLFVVVQNKYIFKAKDKFASYPIHVTAWSYGFGTLFMGLSLLYYVFTDTTDTIAPNANQRAHLAVPLVYATLITSALCYGLLTWANKILSPIVVTAFWPLQVVVTVILSALVFSSQLVAAQYGGGCMIIAGLFLVTFAKYKEGQAQLEYTLLPTEPVHIQAD